MDFLPDSLKRAIDELSQLPGIGPKSAQRLAFYLLKRPEHQSERLGKAIAEIKQDVIRCSRCFSLTSQDPCKICDHAHRDARILCIVETTMDLLAVEKTGQYKGLYHVLGGKLSPLDGVGPDDLTMGPLFQRMENESFDEIILALNPDLEGDTTALYIQRKLEGMGRSQSARSSQSSRGEDQSTEANVPKISRIARGIPSGGHLEYTDDHTLIRALEGRQEMR